VFVCYTRFFLYDPDQRSQSLHILSHSSLYIYVCLDYVGTRYCIGKYTVCLWMPEQPIIIHWHINKSLPSLPAENICICFMCSVVTLYFVNVLEQVQSLCSSSSQNMFSCSTVSLAALPQYPYRLSVAIYPSIPRCSLKYPLLFPLRFPSCSPSVSLAVPSSIPSCSPQYP